MVAYVAISSLIFAAVALFGCWVAVECYIARDRPPHDGGAIFFGVIAAAVCIVNGGLATWGFYWLVQLLRR